MKLFSKKTFIAAVVFIVAEVTAFSLGAGAQFNLTPSFLINQDGAKNPKIDFSAIGTFKFDRLSAAIGAGLNAGFHNSSFTFGPSVFFDYWAINFQIENTLNFYSGVGASAALVTDIKNWKFETGVRFFAGLNKLLIDNYIEIYVQQNIVPSYSMILGNNADFDSQSFRFNFPLEIGTRLHF